jgi:hypothetical protein
VKKEAPRLKTITVRVPEPLAVRVKVEAAKRQTTIQKLLVTALAEYFKEERK